MHLGGELVAGSVVVGLLVGMTGAGGGALMTPMLIFFFGVPPSAAISSDLVATLLMRPVGGAIHLHRGTVDLRMVGWLAVGSVPAAFAGSLVLRALGAGAGSERTIEVVLGAALLLGAAANVGRGILRRRRAEVRLVSTVHELRPRPLPTVVAGIVGGLMVGTTSVGAGSLVIVLLLFVYPAIGATQLVGTDLVQAIPLTASAALGQLLFGHVDLAVTGSLIVGGVPAVVVGSLLSSRAPDRFLRPLVSLVVVASGLKYVGVGTAALLCTVAGLVVVAGGWWLVGHRVVGHRRTGHREVGHRLVERAGAGARVVP